MIRLMKTGFYLLLVVTVASASRARRTPLLGQDGHAKTLAPWVSHQHLPLNHTLHSELYSQRDIHQKRMERANKIKVEEELGQRGSVELPERSTESVVERALKWVVQIEYSGQTFFDG